MLDNGDGNPWDALISQRDIHGVIKAPEWTVLGLGEWPID
jgi:hypothetical protein